MAVVPKSANAKKRKSTKRSTGNLSVVKARSRSNGTKSLIEALTASIPQAMAALDGRRRIMFTNSAFDRMFGVSNIGDRVSAYFDPPGLKNIFKQCALTSKPVEKRELVIPTESTIETEVSYSVTVAPHSDLELKTKFLLLVDDTTEGSDREDRMIANSRLVSVGEMAAGVAHELNNPLTAVLGFSQLAIDRSPPTRA